MNDFPWLTLLILVPLVGGTVAALLPAAPGATLPKQVALLASGLTLAVAIAIAVQYDAGAGMQFTETHVWIEAFGAYYALGVDGIALTLVLLTALLVPVVLRVSASCHEASTTTGTSRAVSSTRVSAMPSTPTA